MSERRLPGAALFRQKDFVAGLLFAVIGIGVAVGGSEYGIGSARRMGPGYFPVMIGGTLVLIGSALVVKAFLARISDPVPRLHPRPLLALVASVFAFGLLINRVGLIAACFATVMISGLASSSTRWLEMTLIAMVMSLFAALVFVQFLGLPMRLWIG